MKNKTKAWIALLAFNVVIGQVTNYLFNTDLFFGLIVLILLTLVNYVVIGDIKEMKND